eukprot:1147622-Pelagomonas_calceolata.AAC.7
MNAGKCPAHTFTSSLRETGYLGLRHRVCLSPRDKGQDKVRWGYIAVPAYEGSLAEAKRCP